MPSANELADDGEVEFVAIRTAEDRNTELCKSAVDLTAEDSPKKKAAKPAKEEAAKAAAEARAAKKHEEQEEKAEQKKVATQQAKKEKDEKQKAKIEQKQTEQKARLHAEKEFAKKELEFDIEQAERKHEWFQLLAQNGAPVKRRTIAYMEWETLKSKKRQLEAQVAIAETS